MKDFIYTYLRAPQIKTTVSKETFYGSRRGDKTKEKVHYSGGQLFGCVCAMRFGDGIALGWSIANKKDTFRKDQALKIAKGRMIGIQKKFKPLSNDVSALLEYPEFIEPYINAFTTKAKNYFLKDVVRNK